MYSTFSRYCQEPITCYVGLQRKQILIGARSPGKGGGGGDESIPRKFGWGGGVRIPLVHTIPYF